MSERSAILSLLFFFFVSKILCQTEAPIDLYLAFDQSGSLSEKRFRQLVDFGEALSFGVADITGFYSGDSNGLRVGAVTFGCGTQTKERLLPTGDAQRIRDRMENMRTFVKTFGETCLEPALQLLLGYKDNQATIAPPVRSTALVVLSDGRFDDFNAWQDEISTFMDDRSQGFSVGIGDKVRESQMITIADSNPDKYFHLNEPEALPTLIELIASMVINDFQIEIINTDTGETIPPEGELCVGQSISAKIIGQSLQVISSTSDVTCDFLFPDGAKASVTATATEINGESILVCENPDISATYDTVTVDLRVNGNRVHSEVVSLQRNTCISSTKFVADSEVENFQNCFGGVSGARIEYTGITAELLLQRLPSITCEVSFTAGASNSIETFPGSIQTLSNQQGFACILPDILFEVEKLDAATVQVKILVDSDELGQLSAIEQTIDTSFRTDCLEIGLVNSQNDGELCLGDNVQLSVSGETASNVISSIERGSMTIQGCSITYKDGRIDTGLEYTYDPVQSQLFCTLPYQFGLRAIGEFDLRFNLRFASGREDFLGFSISEYVLNECFGEGFPKRVVVQSTDGERVENERFCAGDGYDIEFSGPTAENFIQIRGNVDLDLELFCDFYKIDNPNEILFTQEAIRRSDNVIICSALVWNPYDPILAEYFDYSEVKLVMRNSTNDMVAQSVDVNIYTGNSLCFDNPDHQVPPAFAPPEDSAVSRSLQESCYPFCCRRPSVSIGFTGRTIAVISAAQDSAAGSRLRCVYTTVDGNTVETAVVLNGPQASCSPAPGWRLRGNTGDYTLVELELVEASGNVRKFSRFDYNPSTGSTNCVNNVPESFYCLGESVAFRSYGLTLLALFVDETLTYDSTLFNVFLNGETLDVTIIDDEVHTVLSTWQRFDVSRIIERARFQLNAEDVVLGDEEFSDVTIENRDRCLGIVIAEATCGLLDEQQFFTSAVSGSGEALNFYPPSEGTYSCRFFVTQSEAGSAPKILAEVNIAQRTVSCSVLEESAYSGYQIIFTNATDNRDIILKEGSITRSVAECNDPIGGGDRNGPDSPDPLTYLLPIALIVLFALIILLLIYKRRQVKNKNLPTAAVIGTVFAVGDKVDVFVTSEKLKDEDIEKLDSQGVKPENSGFWFSGKVTERTSLEASSEASSIGSDIESGEKMFSYNIVLDSSMASYHIPSEQLQHVILPNIRQRLSSFSVGQHVTPSSDKQLCEVKEILPNNKYEVATSENKTLVFDGSELIPLEEMKFKVDDLVFFVAGDSKYQSSGKITKVDMLNQKYSIDKLDDGVKFIIPATGVFELSYTAGNIVHVKVEEDGDISWKRAVIVKELSEGKYEVKTGSYGHEKVLEVMIKDIRNPVFEIGDKVEVLTDAENRESLTSVRTEDWEPGFIKGFDKDLVNYNVLMTRKNKTETVHATAIRKLEMEEVIKRIRRGVPLRTSNLDSNVPDSGADIVPIDKRFRRRKPVDYTELPDHQFDITVDPSDGLGVKFGWTDEKVIVAGFRDMKNGDWGVLEATGLVMVKDQLIKIDSVDVANFGISDIAELIEKSKKNKKITLRFGRSEEFKSKSSSVVQS